ncbi:hypothetical protein [Streptomyces tropicalis]|uniref:SbtR family transcriptional regulator n=1 Tax=Streptomyces tropicalis TaxID=3034234 RepID=UPI003F68B043
MWWDTIVRGSAVRAATMPAHRRVTGPMKAVETSERRRGVPPPAAGWMWGRPRWWRRPGSSEREHDLALDVPSAARSCAARASVSTNVLSIATPSVPVVAGLRRTDDRVPGRDRADAAAVQGTEAALHASCTPLRAAGARLLARAPNAGAARSAVKGGDPFAPVAVLARLGDQPALAPCADHLFEVAAGAMPTSAGSSRRTRPQRYVLVAASARPSLPRPARSGHGARFVVAVRAAAVPRGPRPASPPAGDP